MSAAGVCQLVDALGPVGQPVGNPQRGGYMEALH